MSTAQFPTNETQEPSYKQDVNLDPEFPSPHITSGRCMLVTSMNEHLLVHAQHLVDLGCRCFLKVIF
jgi:hypothetical protein